MIKKIAACTLTAAFVLLSLSSGALAQNSPAVGKQAVAIYGHGNSKCADYNEFRFQQNKPIIKNYQVWLNGMLSAYNTFISPTGDVATGLKSDELMLWIEDFCRLNPETYFQRAAIELLRALEANKIQVGQPQGQPQPQTPTPQ